MVAPIAADIDPKWVGTEESRRVARELWALPWVEAGTHTYSHPFYWQFFESGDANLEIPYLRNYKSPTWKPKQVPEELKGKGEPLPMGYIIPRGFAVEPFEIHKEVEGSLKEMAALLPKGKRIEILAWPGNCSPWEEVVHMTREAKIQNINGGDTRFDPEYPAYASVAPIGRQVGKERQIYASTSNENTYTNLWSENFHAFRYLRKTIDSTETPLRLKPFSIYYHMYSGEREASLSSLLGNLNYARAQDVIPLVVSYFTHIAEGFYDAQLVALGNDSWRVEHRGTLSTIRFDQGTLKAVDFERSQGVIGERPFQGSLYVYLDSAVAAPVIALKNNEYYYTLPEEKTAYLVESRWLVSGLSRTGNRLEFTAQGFGNGEMVWQVGAPGNYRVTVNGKTSEVKVAGDRMLKLRIEEKALEPLHVTITETGNA
jgi:hypothetical protein